MFEAGLTGVEGTKGGQVSRERGRLLIGIIRKTFPLAHKFRINACLNNIKCSPLLQKFLKLFLW